MKGKNKIIIISTIVAVFIIAGIIGILYTKTDVFKTEEELFYKYLLSTKVVDDGVTQRYAKIAQRIGESNYTSNGTLNCSIASNDQTTNISNIQNILGVKYNILNNKNLEQNYADFTVSSDNNDIATLRYLKDGDTYAIKVDNVVTKYLALQNRNLKDFFKKLGVTDTSKIPDSISQDDYKNLMNISEEQLNSIKSTYTKILTDKLQENNFTKITNTDKSKTIELSLTQKEIAEIEKAMLETLKNDESTLNLIIEKAKIYGNEYNKDSMKTSIQETIDELTDGINNGKITDNPGFFKLAVRVTNKKTTVVDFKLTYVDEKDNSIRKEITAKIDLSESNKITVFLNDGTENNEKIEISFGYENNGILANIEVSELDNNNNIKSSVLKIQHEILNYETDNISQNMLVTIMGENNQKIQVSANNQLQLKQDVQIEKITNENATILNDRSQTELNQLIYQIVLRIQYLFGDTVSGFMN